MSGYLLSPSAEADLDSAWIEIALDNPNAADRLVVRFFDAFEHIGNFPELGESLARISLGLRFVVVAPHVVVYRTEEKKPVIVRILHSARKWEDLL